MASHGDRAAIESLQRLPHNLRDASGSLKADPWQGKKPVIIQTPSNSTRYSGDMAKTPAKSMEGTTRKRAAGRDVFGSRSIARASGHNVGNPTAAATFMQRTSSVSHYNQERPMKRQKIDNYASAPAAFSSSGGAVAEKPKIKRQPDAVPIVVDTDDDEVTVLSHNANHLTSEFKVSRDNFDQDDALSDDLNIHSGELGSAQRASKFLFENSKKKTTPDGPNTTALMKQKVYNLESDPIEQFTDQVSPPPGNNGYVKEQALKIDLRSVHNGAQSVKLKSLKMKMKPREKQPNVADFTEPAPVYSADTGPSHPTKEGFVVNECYIDEEWFGSGLQQVLRMHLGRDGQLHIEDNQTTHFKEVVKIFCVMHPNPPCSGQDIIQLRNLLDRKPHLLTIRLDLPSLTITTFIEMMQKMRKYGAKVETHKASQQLWQIAEQNVGTVTEDPKAEKSEERRGTSEPRSRMDELDRLQKGRKHDLGPAPASSRVLVTQRNTGKRKADEASLKYTPPGDVEEIHHKPKTIKKPNAPSNMLSQEPTRRSSRQQEAKEPTEPKKVKDLKNDELILSYPQGQPGAVNVTAGDLNRLDPGEFLNDTLIEFGLKFWLSQLEKSNPELASQVHVFNSFFYKKFNQKDLQVGYQSVRKWTNKIDIFQKKYIVVPINEHLHWYLIVIHEPEHVLTSHGPLPTPPSRRNTRLAAAEAEQVVHLSTEEASSTSANTPITSEDADRTSEAEVERDLHDFQNSCSIAEPDSRMASPPVPDSEDNFSDMYGDPVPTVHADTEAAKGDEFTELVATNFTSDDGLEPLKPTSPSSDVMVIDVDRADFPSSTAAAVAEAGSSKDHNRNGDSPPTATLLEVEPASFYKPVEKTYTRKGQEKAQDLSTAPAPMDADSKEDDGEVVVVTDSPQSRIFTFDSLGSRHPAAVKKLATYLQMEAKDKKGVENAGLATGEHAPVPCQQNFCDCGVFLLHFTETFFSDPKKYADVILSKGKPPTGAERSELWRQAELHNDQGRTKLKKVITHLSTEWKLQRATTNEQISSELDSKEKVKVEESDDDIEVIDVQGVKKGKPKAAVGNTAKRKTGPANRTRR